MVLIKRRVKLPLNRQYFSALLTGSEGGLSTTTAIIAGLMISTDQPDLVVLIAVISFLVQAFNNAIGRFSSEYTDQELDGRRKWLTYGQPARDAFAQFTAHIVMSTLVLLPIVLVADVTRAIVYSITITLFFLFVIGFYKGRLARTNALRDGIELLVLGSLIISVGIAAGLILRV